MGVSRRDGLSLSPVKSEGVCLVENENGVGGCLFRPCFLSLLATVTALPCFSLVLRMFAFFRLLFPYSIAFLQSFNHTLILVTLLRTLFIIVYTICSRALTVREGRVCHYSKIFYHFIVFWFIRFWVSVICSVNSLARSL